MRRVGKCLASVAMVAFVLLAGGSRLGAQTMVPWLTRSGDNARSGWNPHETLLTQASVGTRGLARPPGRGGRCA